jgi:hypothetical protein
MTLQDIMKTPHGLCFGSSGLEYNEENIKRRKFNSDIFDYAQLKVNVK